MFQVLLVALLSAFSAQAVLIAQMDVYGNGCSGSKTSLPFLLGNTCMKLSAASSAKVNCGGSSFDTYSSGDCTGTVSSLPFTCTNLGDLGGGAGGGGSIPNFGFGFSCIDRPASNFVLLEMGTGCSNGAVTGVSQTVVQIVNECMALPVFGQEPSMHYMVTISGRTLTFKLYSAANCDGTPAQTDTMTLGDCGAFSGLGGAGRTLQSANAKFSLLSGSGRVSSVLSAMAALVLVVATVFVNIM